MLRKILRGIARRNKMAKRNHKPQLTKIMDSWKYMNPNENCNPVIAAWPFIRGL